MAACDHWIGISWWKKFLQFFFRLVLSPFLKFIDNSEEAPLLLISRDPKNFKNTYFETKKFLRKIGVFPGIAILCLAAINHCLHFKTWPLFWDLPLPALILKKIWNYGLKFKKAQLYAEKICKTMILFYPMKSNIMMYFHNFQLKSR